jgi:predicted Rossmann fold flavoprotein
MNAPKKNKSPKNRASAIFPQTGSGFTVAIVGGGASGIAAACAICAHAQRFSVQLRIVLIEKSRKIGSSILRSGNGRCNFSHANIRSACFNQPVFVDKVLTALESTFAFNGDTKIDPHLPPALHSLETGMNAVLRWFFELGLVWNEAPHTGGLLYPYSNKATSVLEVLQAELDRYKIEQACGIEAISIEQRDGRFVLQLQDFYDESHSESFRADAVVLAVGGRQENGSLYRSELFKNASFAQSRFVLGPLRTKTRFLEGLDGIRVHARLSCSDGSFSEEGEVLFRTYGISGIVVFNASRFANTGDMISLDLAPDLTLSELGELLIARTRCYEQRTEETPTYGVLLRGLFLPELARAILRWGDSIAPKHTLATDQPVSSDGIDHLARCIKHFELTVLGAGDENQCQVCRGGLRVDMIDPDTMESRFAPGLYVTGEALDIDGPCGGYNLHWAWASGLLAGASIAKSAQNHGDADMRQARRDET